MLTDHKQAGVPHAAYNKGKDMAQLLELALVQERSTALRTLDETVNRLNGEAAAKGMFNSGRRIVGIVHAYKESAAQLIAASFRQALAVHEKAGATELQAREAAIDHAGRYIEELRNKLDNVLFGTQSSVGSGATAAARTQFAEIDQDFARQAELYRAGIDTGSTRVLPAPTHYNSIKVLGDGNTLIAQQGSSHSTQSVHQTNAVLENLARAIDEQPLTGSSRREVEKELGKLQAEAVNSAPDKGRIASLLANISAGLGIAKDAPAVVQAITDASRALGIG